MLLCEIFQRYETDGVYHLNVHVTCEDAQRALDEEIRLLRSGFTDKYLKDLKDKERQMELLLRKAEELAAYPPPSR